MKMFVTGISNEQDFETGSSSYVLILNKEIRVPISEEVATVIIQKMYGKTPEPVDREQDDVDPNEVPDPQTWQRTDDTRDEDGIDQI